MESWGKARFAGVIPNRGIRMLMNSVWRVTAFRLTLTIGLGIGGATYGKFFFQSKNPIGDFKISGIWGGEIGNSRTIGFVDSGLLIYKGFTITNADIEVEVDSNSTKIKSDNIVHDKGNLAGSLTFPRKHLNSPVFLSFQIDGQYPLNDARTIFGETI